MSDRWTTPEKDPRTYGNPVGELETYREYLTNYRLTIELKCEGLGPDDLARRSVPPSTLSLLGLIRHLAQMENHWFQRVLQGRTAGPRLYKSADDPDGDFAGATADPATVQEAFATWKAEIASADEWLDGQAGADLGEQIAVHDGTASIRDILVHVVEEYARHAGHADLLRECIDGRTGQ
ncbi:MAG: DinB family protein [Intrasporangium sp.]|uniref:DinB family protein n=1 Tax=Intrasporangium sp. TaxID=1925024 RepID=UPI0026482DFD|nr:DinB family protein [Intrasporangium sp.]MDN5795697.1 DinB family protein [Intrasporangium sp.]